MDLQFLREQIKDELSDSKMYAKIAIELKPMTEVWSKKFMEMSADEHKHATNLYGMFNEYCSKISDSYDTVPEYVTEAREDVIESYASCTAVIKEMWAIYK